MMKSWENYNEILGILWGNFKKIEEILGKLLGTFRKIMMIFLKNNKEI